MNTFLSTCHRQKTSHTPIWLMRQAGRYQPEYRAIRSKLSFIELCHNSDAATEVSLLPVTQLGVDAAIIFADILLILEPMGIGFEFTRDDGPTIGNPIRTPADVARVTSDIDAPSSLGYVMDVVRKTRAGLAADKALIGFAGAPFTLASYAIEGGGSRNYTHAKGLMYSAPAAFAELMDKLARAVAGYLAAQVKAGADAVQIFDSWVGCLGPDDYRAHVLPHMKTLFSEFRRSCSSTPVITFATGNPALYPLVASAGGDVVGIDWRSSIADVWPTLGDVAIQGNLDPSLLLAPRDVLFSRANDVLASAGGRPGHIFNLGHGVYPEVSVDQVRALVDHVHERSAR